MYMYEHPIRLELVFHGGTNPLDPGTVHTILLGQNKFDPGQLTQVWTPTFEPALTQKCWCYILVQLDPDIGVEPVNTKILGQFQGQTQNSGFKMNLNLLIQSTPGGQSVLLPELII